VPLPVLIISDTILLNISFLVLLRKFINDENNLFTK